MSASHINLLMADLAGPFPSYDYPGNHDCEDIDILESGDVFQHPDTPYKDFCLDSDDAQAGHNCQATNHSIGEKNDLVPHPKPERIDKEYEDNYVNINISRSEDRTESKRSSSDQSLHDGCIKVSSYPWRAAVSGQQPTCPNSQINLLIKQQVWGAGWRPPEDNPSELLATSENKEDSTRIDELSEREDYQCTDRLQVRPSKVSDNKVKPEIPDTEYTSQVMNIPGSWKLPPWPNIYFDTELESPSRSVVLHRLPYFWSLAIDRKYSDPEKSPYRSKVLWGENFDGGGLDQRWTVLHQFQRNEKTLM